MTAQVNFPVQILQWFSRHRMMTPPNIYCYRISERTVSLSEKVAISTKECNLPQCAKKTRRQDAKLLRLSSTQLRRSHTVSLRFYLCKETARLKFRRIIRPGYSLRVTSTRIAQRKHAGEGKSSFQPYLATLGELNRSKFHGAIDCGHSRPHY